jgi:hypothetical protein
VHGEHQQACVADTSPLRRPDDHLERFKEEVIDNTDQHVLPSELIGDGLRTGSIASANSCASAESRALIAKSSSSS